MIKISRYVLHLVLWLIIGVVFATPIFADGPSAPPPNIVATSPIRINPSGPSYAKRTIDCPTCSTGSSGIAAVTATAPITATTTGNTVALSCSTCGYFGGNINTPNCSYFTVAGTGFTCSNPVTGIAVLRNTTAGSFGTMLRSTGGGNFTLTVQLGFQGTWGFTAYPFYGLLLQDNGSNSYYFSLSNYKVSNNAYVGDLIGQNNSAQSQNTSTFQNPAWLRLTVTGQSVTGAISLDGIDFDPAFTTTLGWTPTMAGVFTTTQPVNTGATNSIRLYNWSGL